MIPPSFRHDPIPLPILPQRRRPDVVFGISGPPAPTMSAIIVCDDDIYDNDPWWVGALSIFLAHLLSAALVIGIIFGVFGITKIISVL